MNRWGAFVARRSRAVLALAAAIVVTAAAYGLGVFLALDNGGFDDPGSESAVAAELIADHFPEGLVDAVAIYRDPARPATDPAVEQAVTRVVAALPASAVRSAVTYYESGNPAQLGDDGHATRVFITLAGQSQDEKTASYDAIKDRLAAPGLETHVAGSWAVFDDVNEQVGGDIARAESLTMPIVFVLSLLVFGSLVAALMPTLVGGIAVLGAFAIVRLLTGLTDISVFAINVITLLGMGLAIDYALFVVARFREELAGQPDGSRASARRAIAATVATAGRTVMFSGLIVAASLGSLLVFPQGFLRSMALGGMAAVLVAMVAALTVLPALLTVLGPRIDWVGMPWRRSLHDRAISRPAGQTTGAWARLGRSVMRRPVAYLVAVGAVLLVLASPFWGARWGGVDERVLPADSPSHAASIAQADWFGGQQASAPIVLTGATAQQAQAYAARVAALPGIDQVVPGGSATIDGRPSALVTAYWTGEGQVPASQDMVRAIRDVRPEGGTTAYVTGQSAATVDMIDSVCSRLPWMGVLVAGIMLVMLFLAFGSVVLPLKAIVVGLVSISASFGVVTWIFQEGHLSSWLGFTAPGYLDATQPILMLAILFGLSMDYEVFLLSRVREEWDRSGDNEAAVAGGLQHTGAIITSAAVLLSVVIGGFATSGIVFLKMIGIGMLVAVLIDATIVRSILVPATMRLLGGRVNWWAPGPLSRVWERYGHREGPGDLPRPVRPEPVPAAS